MSQPQVIPTDLAVLGNLSAKTVSFPPSSIAPKTLGGGVGNYQPASVMQQQYQEGYSQVSTANAATDRKVVHVVRGLTATLLDFVVGAVQACTGTGNAVFDLLKNGVSILTGTITLGSGTAAFATVNGTLASTALVAGDVLEVKVVSVTAGSGALAQGLFARLALNEDPN